MGGEKKQVPGERQHGLISNARLDRFEGNDAQGMAMPKMGSSDPVWVSELFGDMVPTRAGGFEASPASKRIELA